jgi:hypothetical protein
MNYFIFGKHFFFGCCEHGDEREVFVLGRGFPGLLSASEEELCSVELFFGSVT